MATSIASLNVKLMIFSVIGLSISVYAFVVEKRLEENDKYEAMCDIHEHMSCTKAFSSPCRFLFHLLLLNSFGKGFGILPPNSIFYQPNSLYGIIHYSILIFLFYSNSCSVSRFALFLVILSNISSAYFAYILYFILSDFCIVCVSIYIVNAILLLYSLSKYLTIKNRLEKHKARKQA